MNVKAERIVGWERVLNNARATVGKPELNKEPSDLFKIRMLISEHSPIRSLLYEIVWEDIPYWTAMHFRTHSAGFKSSDDDLYFIQTQRTDRTQKERDSLPQDAPVLLRAQINAQSFINVSRVRLCNLSAKETIAAWKAAISKVSELDGVIEDICVPNCVYRGVCPESLGCNYYKTHAYENALKKYRSIVETIRKPL
jgi:hypothetical protein